MRSVKHFLRYSSLKRSKQTFTVHSAIVNSFTPFVFPSEANGETEKNSLSLLWKILLPSSGIQEKTRRHSEIKQTRPSTKQDFSGEALSKQNTEASLASLSCNSSRAMTEWSAIFAFGVLVEKFWIILLKEELLQVQIWVKNLTPSLDTCFPVCGWFIDMQQTAKPVFHSAGFKKNDL